MPNRKNNRLLQYRQLSSQALPLVTNPDDYYSLKEVSYLFDVDERTIYNWRMENKITGILHNRHVLFEKKAIDAVVERYKRLNFF